MRRPITFLERLSHAAVRFTGGSLAFALALAVVLIWLVTGPIFGFSDTWQLVINTGTTVITFLMVFLIQRSQNKESMAIQLKLNEVVAAMEGASNRLINVESLSEAEVERIQRHYAKLVELARHDDLLTHSHSIEEATHRHGRKLRRLRPGDGAAAHGGKDDTGHGPALSNPALVG
jgi:low affinity Fe/Cu permease